MRVLDKALIVGLALSAGTAAASASHGKPGLWNITITLGGHAIDMSKIPPDVAARMKAAGIGANAVTVPHCMTAAEVAADTPHLDPRSARSCAMTNMARSGHTMNADLVCTGDFKGTEHLQFTYDSDTHYFGTLKMSGAVNGRPVTREQTMEGRWVSPHCGSVAN
ncbi:MAG: DUF3617 domain-containing protein [Rhizomicrobium sp.]